MRETPDVDKSGLKLRKDFEDTLGLMNGPQPFGDLDGVYIRAASNSYGLHCKHDLSCPKSGGESTAGCAAGRDATAEPHSTRLE